MMSDLLRINCMFFGFPVFWMPHGGVEDMQAALRCMEKRMVITGNEHIPAASLWTDGGIVVPTMILHDKRQNLTFQSPAVDRGVGRNENIRRIAASSAIPFFVVSEPFRFHSSTEKRQHFVSGMLPS